MLRPTSADPRSRLEMPARFERVQRARMHDLTPRELASALAARPIALIDVREPHEWAIGRISGARLVPLDTLPRSIAQLNAEDEIVVYCHHGVRSAMAAEWMRDQGFSRVRNLIGGIDRWSVEVDASVRRY